MTLQRDWQTIHDEVAEYSPSQASGLRTLRDDMLRDIPEPKWEATSRVHDWRNYVPEFVQARWDKLSNVAKICIYVMAKEQAEREEWE